MKPFLHNPIKLLLVFLVLVMSGSQSYSAFAQTALFWSSPAKIPGLRESDFDPVFLADSEGTVHLFHSQVIGEVSPGVAADVSIFYTSWTLQGGWSDLVDVIPSQRGNPRVYGTHLDQQGWLHLIYFSGNDVQGNIYYTRAPVVSAGISSAWLEPVLIGNVAITPSNAALIGNGQGFLMAVYSGSVQGNGLYFAESFDGGISWSLPEPLFLTYNTQLKATVFRFCRGNGNRLYAAWSVNDETGNSHTIYFSRYEMADRQWTPPVPVAEGDNFDIDTPALIEHRGQVILVYHYDFPTTRWMRISEDAGKTWSQPVRLFEQIGSNGAASLVEDSQQQAYMLFGNRVGNPSIHGVWQSTWFGDHWSKPEAVISGPQIRIGPNGEEGFDPSNVQATIVQGNILFALWRHDPQAGPTNIWFSYRKLDAPEIPFSPLPTIIPTPTTAPTSIPPQLISPTSTSEVIATVSPILTATLEPETPTAPSTSNPNISILLGIIPVGLLIVIAIVIQRRSR